MRTRLAAIAAITLMIALSVPAHADPVYVDANVNYRDFLKLLAIDGFVINEEQAIQEGQAVCKLMQPPDGGSLWDATQQVKSMHPGWSDDSALQFADRAVQFLCPHRGGTF